MILLQRLGQIFIHLGLYTAFPVTHHCVSSEGNNGCPLCPKAALIFSDLAGRFESTLNEISQYIAHNLNRELKAYHNGHLHVHKDDVKPPVLDHFYSLQTIGDHRHDMVVFLQDLDG